MLLRSVTVRGRRRLPNQEVPSAPKNAREVVKFNQVQGMYVEFCDFAVGTDNTIDAVAVQVRGAGADLAACTAAGGAPGAPCSRLKARPCRLQYGHVLWSWLHKTGFGVYFKGGSAHILFSGNRVFDTGEDGLALAAGFDTGGREGEGAPCVLMLAGMGLLASQPLPPLCLLQGWNGWCRPGSATRWFVCMGAGAGSACAAAGAVLAGCLLEPPQLMTRCAAPPLSAGI